MSGTGENTSEMRSWEFHRRFVPKNEYGEPLPIAERWGNIMYERNKTKKLRNGEKIRSKFIEEHRRALNAPENVSAPSLGNMKRNKNGITYKWSSVGTKGPHWQRVSNKFGYHANVGNAIRLEKEHGFRYNKLLKKTRRGTRRANTRRASRRGSQRK